MSMNKEKLKELAATLNGIAEGKAWEIEWVLDDWWPPLEVGVQEALKAGYNIRLKPMPPPQQHDPYAELKVAKAAGKTIQALSADGKWRDWVGGDDFAPREPSNLRIKPETRRVNANPVRIPLCADDIKSGDEFLAPDGNRRQWERISDKGISFVWAYASWSELKQNGWKIRSIGETEWRECSKEEEVEA